VQPEVMMGGGTPNFLPKSVDGRRTDDVNYINSPTPATGTMKMYNRRLPRSPLGSRLGTFGLATLGQRIAALGNAALDGLGLLTGVGEGQARR
jgi:hypothetical protein